jgi:nitrogen fixation protein FixH
MFGISQESNHALKNPWVLGFIGFFCTFVTANIIFITLSFKAPPALVVDDFYEKGQAYEETQKRIAEERSLGWTGLLMTPATIRVNQTQTYDIFLHGKNSASLDLDTVTFFAYRPSDKEADFALPMKQKQPGIYTIDAGFSLPGIWDVIVEAKQGDQRFLTTKRISVKP